MNIRRMNFLQRDARRWIFLGLLCVSSALALGLWISGYPNRSVRFPSQPGQYLMAVPGGFMRAVTREIPDDAIEIPKNFQWSIPGIRVARFLQLSRTGGRVSIFYVRIRWLHLGLLLATYPIF